jgi:hypothetical protein
LHYQYQNNFSNNHQELYHYEERKLKAKKILSILNDYFNKNVKEFQNFKLLDIGSSTGIMTHFIE